MPIQHQGLVWVISPLAASECWDGANQDTPEPRGLPPACGKEPNLSPNPAQPSPSRGASKPRTAAGLTPEKTPGIPASHPPQQQKPKPSPSTTKNHVEKNKQNNLVFFIKRSMKNLFINFALWGYTSISYTQEYAVLYRLYPVRNDHIVTHIQLQYKPKNS